MSSVAVVARRHGLLGVTWRGKFRLALILQPDAGTILGPAGETSQTNSLPPYHIRTGLPFGANAMALR